MSVPRPSTHPGEQYRRAREALTVQIADVMNLLGHLDPVELLIAGDELIELLADVVDDVYNAMADVPVRDPRAVMVVDTKGRT